MCWAEEVGVDTPPPQVKDPIHSRLDMITAVKDRKNVGKARGVLRCKPGNPWPTNA